MTAAIEEWPVSCSTAHAAGRQGLPSQINASGLQHVAVENPEGSFVLVMSKPGEAKDLRIVCGSQQLSLSLPRDSVASVAR
jgi:hypothetical protein